MNSIIDKIEAWHCRVTLDKPIMLGTLVIEHREFVVARVSTADGVEGVAYSLSRGAPIDLTVTELLAPLLLGQNALDIPRRNAELVRAVVALGPTGVVQRAISLLDICLWDIKSRVAGLPVWRLLGGYRESAEVMLVAPYALPEETDLQYAARLAEIACRGYAAMKLYPAADRLAMARRLEAVRSAVGKQVGLVVDMAWSWQSVRQAIEAVQTWEDFDLSWIEDPFPASDWQAIQALANAVRTPIGAGDEVSVRSTIESLITERAVDIVRLDATSIGGFSQFASLRELAQRAGYAISPHAYPEIHRHCLYAWPDVGPLEIFPPGSPTWGASRFLADEIDLPHGSAEVPAPTEAGLGLRLDWDAVASLATRASAAIR